MASRGASGRKRLWPPASGVPTTSPRPGVARIGSGGGRALRRAQGQRLHPPESEPDRGQSPRELLGSHRHVPPPPQCPAFCTKEGGVGERCWRCLGNNKRSKYLRVICLCDTASSVHSHRAQTPLDPGALRPSSSRPMEPTSPQTPTTPGSLRPRPTENRPTQPTAPQDPRPLELTAHGAQAHEPQTRCSWKPLGVWLSHTHSEAVGETRARMLRGLHLILQKARQRFNQL